MKVLILFTSSELGGAERSLTRMAAFSPSPVHYCLGTLDGNGEWMQWAAEIGLTPIAFGKDKLVSNHGKFGLREILSAIQFVHNRQIEIVYVVGLRASLILRLFKRSFKKTKIIHGVRWNPRSDSRLDYSFRQIERLSSGLIDFYIVNSQVTAKTLIEDCHVREDKIEVIYNGLSELPQNLIVYEKRPLHIVTVANLNPRKGYLEYLSVVRQVVERFPTAKFYFVGRDDMNGQVQAAVASAGLESNVFCTGFMPEVGYYLENARIFVLPSQWGEGCPTSILEAMSYGLPVVAYSIDGIPELLDYGVNGFLISRGNTQDMLDKLVWLLENPELAGHMGAANRVKVASRFSLDLCSKKHSKVFKKLMI